MSTTPAPRTFTPIHEDSPTVLYRRGPDRCADCPHVPRDMSHETDAANLLPLPPLTRIADVPRPLHPLQRASAQPHAIAMRPSPGVTLVLPHAPAGDLDAVTTAHPTHIPPPRRRPPPPSSVARAYLVLNVVLALLIVTTLALLAARGAPTVVRTESHANDR